MEQFSCQGVITILHLKDSRYMMIVIHCGLFHYSSTKSSNFLEWMQAKTLNLFRYQRDLTRILPLSPNWISGFALIFYHFLVEDCLPQIWQKKCIHKCEKLKSHCLKGWTPSSHLLSLCNCMLIQNSRQGPTPCFVIHTRLLKISSLHLPTIYENFWCLMLPSYVSFFFVWFMLFASTSLLDMTRKPSCILLSKHKFYITAIAGNTSYIPYMPI